MSNLKYSENLFLGAAELNRSNKFIFTDGFKNFLLQNSVEYGLVKKENEAFINGLVQEDIGLTIKINELEAIDNAANFIYNPLTTQIAVPADNNWYWVKVSYTFTNVENGIFSIDSFGNLVCTSGNAELLTILRGQPNFPSRIAFSNATNNIFEYDVEEVIDNNNATLTGNFINETGLKLVVVGTFTPGYVPTVAEKKIFQYDSCVVSLIASNTSDAPAHNIGQEFFIARVKNNGSIISIEDKRNEIWKTNANYFLSQLDKIGNPLIGVEQITYDDKLSPKVQNIVQVAWAFTAVAFTINLKLNKITISAGSGGKFKSNNFSSIFTDGDFDGWRLYTSSGSYFKIISSIQVASTIELSMEHLEGEDFFSDIDSLISIVQELIITPDADSIEVVCEADPSSNNLIAVQSKIFNINSSYGRIALNVYASTGTLYNIKYRYKHIKDYSPLLVLPDDSIGFYNENQFDEDGQFVTTPVRTAYLSSVSNGFIPLILNPNAYSNFIANNFLGDRLGVEVLQLSNTVPLLKLVVGSSRQYQYFEDKDASAISDVITLSQDLFINIDKFDYASKLCRNGNFFMLHFKQKIVLNGFNLRIVTDYVNNISYTELKKFNGNDERFLKESEEGIFIRASFDGEDWVLNNVNEVKAKNKFFNSITQYKTLIGGTVDPGININGTSYPNWDIIPGCQMTVPNDGFNRVCQVLVKINIAASNGVNIARAFFRLKNYDTNDQLDYVQFDQSKVVSTDTVTTTLTLQYVGNISPGNLIQLQTIGFAGLGDCNVRDIQFSIIEL